MCQGSGRNKKTRKLWKNVQTYDTCVMVMVRTKIQEKHNTLDRKSIEDKHRYTWHVLNSKKNIQKETTEKSKLMNTLCISLKN